MKKLLLSILCLFFPLIIGASTLHALVVVDTTDRHIHHTCLIDLINVRSQLQGIAHYTGMELQETILADKNFQSCRLWEALDELDTQDDDVIIFYYSGHGFRTDDATTLSPWPILSFSKEQRGICLDDIIDIIARRPSRLKLIISDCCNEHLPIPWAPPRPKMLIKIVADQALMKRNYKRLFCQSRGMIITTSSQAGEQSFCDHQQGGWYTHAFITTLWKRCCTDPEISWDNVFQQTYDALQNHITSYSRSYPADAPQQTPFTVVDDN
ncbi:MAG: caspase family protein [Chlamydiota bacterium]